MKTVTFITTLRHNVGDDFVREGAKYLVQKRFPEHQLVFQSIHKHRPVTSRFGCDWLRYPVLSKVVDKFLPLAITRDKILVSNLVVQSGAPVYWHHPESSCEQNEWYEPLIRRRYSLIKDRVPLVNLAAGSCQRFYSKGHEFRDSPAVQRYIAEFYELSDVTTVRDRLASDILKLQGLSAPLIVCCSIFAVDEIGIGPDKGEYVAMNYMLGGAHYTFNQDIDCARWERVFRSLYLELKKRHNVLLVCHDRNELQHAKRIDPNAKTFFSLDHREYMCCYAKARYGVVNRIHGALMLASLGKPALVVGNDTRARMVDEIGLTSLYVNDVDMDHMLEQCRTMEKDASDFSERIQTRKHGAFEQYMKALSVVEIG